MTVRSTRNDIQYLRNLRHDPIIINFMMLIIRTPCKLPIFKQTITILGETETFIENEERLYYWTIGKAKEFQIKRAPRGRREEVFKLGETPGLGEYRLSLIGMSLASLI